MSGAEVLTATAHDVEARDAQPVLGDDLARSDARLISRLLLAFVLAAVSVLIPGVASRYLEAQVDWSDLFPARWRSLTRMPATASGRSQLGPTPNVTRVA